MIGSALQLRRVFRRSGPVRTGPMTVVRQWHHPRSSIRLPMAGLSALSGALHDRLQSLPSALGAGNMAQSVTLRSRPQIGTFAGSTARHSRPTDPPPAERGGCRSNRPIERRPIGKNTCYTCCCRRLRPCNRAAHDAWAKGRCAHCRPDPRTFAACVPMRRGRGLRQQGTLRFSHRARHRPVIPHNPDRRRMQPFDRGLPAKEYRRTRFLPSQRLATCSDALRQADPRLRSHP